MLDEVDMFVVLVLYMEEPSRSLRSYASWLQHYTGTQVSTTVLGQLFKVAFPFSGGPYHPNLIPFDKFDQKIVSEQWNSYHRKCQSTFYLVW